MCCSHMDCTEVASALHDGRQDRAIVDMVIVVVVVAVVLVVVVAESIVVVVALVVDIILILRFLDSNAGFLHSTAVDALKVPGASF